MTGERDDMSARLRALLPARWFADSAPVLDGALAGAADMAAQSYGMIGYARAQTRVATATDVWLDLIAADLFGPLLAREPGEADAALRARIGAALFLPRATRAAVHGAVTTLGEGEPRVFEPTRPADAGAWNVALGYGVAGGWGSLSLPFQALVTLPTETAPPSAIAALAAVVPAGTIVWTRPFGPSFS